MGCPRTAFCSCYEFGQPSAGFFFASDFFMASRQLPSSLRRSAFGPRVAAFLAGFFLAGIVTIIGLSVVVDKRDTVEQALAFRCLYACDCTLAIVQLAIVPQKIVVPEVAV